jgi:CubicO group peptidase (beta-lactamase class C family)
MAWASNPFAVGIDSERLARIKPAVEKHLGDDKLAGAVTLVARRGKVVHLEGAGLLSRESGTPMPADAIFRIYSMTKPITCVALMTLYEQGKCQLCDPVAKYIPEFADLKVYVDEGLVDLERPVTIRDLLTHTSGLTYHFPEYGPVEQMYRDSLPVLETSLEEFVEHLLRLPLAFQPGGMYRYSYAHDVVAYLIQVLSGESIDVYLREAILESLGMVDTAYYVPEEKADRLASMYGVDDILKPEITRSYLRMRAEAGVNNLISGPDDLETGLHQAFRGGHGLVSTAMDYYRFCQMMLNGGELEGVRILGRKSVELMSTNHLSPALLPYEIDHEYRPGMGYGLGFGVVMDLGQLGSIGSEGTYSWSGAATTSFWIDPHEELIGVQMAQFQPNNYHLINDDFKVAVYQALVD